MSSLSVFYGLVGLLMFGFLAMFMTPIFAVVAPSYDPTIRLIIMAAIPILSVALFFGVFGSGD